MNNRFSAIKKVVSSDVNNGFKLEPMLTISLAILASSGWCRQRAARASARQDGAKGSAAVMDEVQPDSRRHCVLPDHGTIGLDGLGPCGAGDAFPRAALPASLRSIAAQW